MRFCTKAAHSIGVALLAAVSLLIVLLAPASASAKPTTLFHGNSYAVKPANISGWSVKAPGVETQIIRGWNENPQGDWGRIEWEYWGKKKAVGSGGAWSSSCRIDCLAPFPFNGSKVDVVAYGPKRGHFTKLRFRAEDSSSPDEGRYVMNLRFVGDNPGGPNWMVVKVDRGPIAQAASVSASASTKVFDGSALAFKPSTLTGWSADGSVDPSARLLIGGLNGTSKDEPGSIEWKSWNKKKAVGVGTGWTPGCGSPCDATNPWDGTRVRVTAYARKGGQFTKMKVFQWTNWMGKQPSSRENYNMALKYTGLKPSGLSWKVTALDDGIAER